MFLITMIITFIVVFYFSLNASKEEQKTKIKKVKNFSRPLIDSFFEFRESNVNVYLSCITKKLLKKFELNDYFTLKDIKNLKSVVIDEHIKLMTDKSCTPYVFTINHKKHKIIFYPCLINRSISSSCSYTVGIYCEIFDINNNKICSIKKDKVRHSTREFYGKSSGSYYEKETSGQLFHQVYDKEKIKILLA